MVAPARSAINAFGDQLKASDVVEHRVDVKSGTKTREAESARLHRGRGTPFAKGSNCSFRVVPKESNAAAQVDGLRSCLEGKGSSKALPVRLFLNRRVIRPRAHEKEITQDPGSGGRSPPAEKGRPAERRGIPSEGEEAFPNVSVTPEETGVRGGGHRSPERRASRREPFGNVAQLPRERAHLRGNDDRVVVGGVIRGADEASNLRA